ncbi:MAG: hypothetical protein GEU26_09990 [Nitrososphaeraceae archaeon]|nr:hypothetical protein [Nitrososphaeraceae archaeon]
MANIQKSVPEKEEVYHLPGMVVVQFKEYEDGSTIKVPTDRIITEVSKNTAKFGYSIIVFQPHDLVQTDKNGIILDTGLLNSTGVYDLSQLIDTFLSKRKVST